MNFFGLNNQYICRGTMDALSGKMAFLSNKMMVLGTEKQYNASCCSIIVMTWKNEVIDF
ncbi:MAG: hypothetical protein LBG28_10120 [Tannerella sp.]|jgi:hypothetical protein|nr:hypothetical protein [Tannerella sp.]